jgi:hypothetical protein
MDTVTEIEAYIKDQQSASLRFMINSIGLRVEHVIVPRSPSSPPCSIQLIQPGVEDV